MNDDLSNQDLRIAILKYLKLCQNNKIEIEEFCASKFNVGEMQFQNVMKELISDKYVDGFVEEKYVDEEYYRYTPESPYLTMKGEEYLSSQKLTAKVIRVLKNIKETVPFI